MVPSEGSSREERLKGLALAKGWIGRAEFESAADLTELVVQGRLMPGQAEALGLELDRPEASLGPPRSASQDGTSAFKATWVESWGHFADLTLVAEGGMGRIFKALDTRLQRRVALKLLRRDDPELASRFLREASIQAQVEHPHVCRIYEAGEWMGQAFIAMQLIDGETLKAAGRKMALVDKLDVMIQVCEGVHAAHQQGLIHRDLKPSNLMVKQVEGSWRAFVLDFGLARTLAASGLTQSGVVMGTVHYMSPEQARGEERGLDRRTDIYALGATLYELFTGEPPFSNYQGLEALGRILAEDPIPLRRKAPQLPRDLETVVMKCLERNRDRRYGNAREVAGELRRVLEGESVDARRASWPERVYRWSRKNRLGMAAGAGLLFLLTGAGMLVVRDRMEERRRSVFLAQMGTLAERLENRLRIMRLQGGTSRSWSELEEELKDLERHAAQKDDGGPAARYAYGRVLLALGYEEEGAQQLEQAWEAGARGRAVAWSLGEGLVARLRLTRDLSRRLPCEEAGEAWYQTDAAAGRPRAAALLREGLGAGPQPLGYQEALLASMEGHEAESLRRARAVFEAQPWLAEAKLLEGDLLRESALREADEGKALAGLEEAARAFEAAAGAAPEDVRPLLRASACRRQAAVRAQAAGRSTAPLLDQADHLLARARTRSMGATLVGLEEVWVDLAGGGGPGSVAQAERLAEKISVERPDWREATLATIQAHLAQAGADPSDPGGYARAIEAARRLLERSPGHPFGLYLLEEGLMRQAVLKIGSESSPWAGSEGALREIRAAQARGPQRVFHWVFEGRILVARAQREWEQGRDPLASARGTVAALTRALALSPRDARVYRDLAQAYLLQGHYEWWSGAEAEPHLAEARRAAFRAQELAPRDPEPCRLQGEAALVVAELSREQGRDPGPWLAEVRRWAGRLRELGAPSPVARMLEARAELADPRATDQTRARVFQALAGEPGAGGSAGAKLLLARLALVRRQEREALALAREAAKLDPEFGEARWVEALVLQSQAEGLPEGPRRTDLRAQARMAREQALALNPRLERKGAKA
ncbi:MAG TPA: serine/threonine-protein kinase [Holophagaceae bacterium]|nr:serine/threonine-protein kinase [Holophagaceae bacterium]